MPGTVPGNQDWIDEEALDGFPGHNARGFGSDAARRAFLRVGGINGPGPAASRRPPRPRGQEERGP